MEQGKTHGCNYAKGQRKRIKRWGGRNGRKNKGCCYTKCGCRNGERD